MTEFGRVFKVLKNFNLKTSYSIFVLFSFIAFPSVNIKLTEQKQTMNLKPCTGVHEEGSVKIGCGCYDFRQETSRKVKSMDKP